MSNSVSQGVFDPRDYKNTEQDWARRRKPEFMGPGKVIYTREVTRQNPHEEEEAARNQINRFARVDMVEKYRKEQDQQAQYKKEQEQYKREQEEQYMREQEEDAFYRQQQEMRRQQEDLGSQFRRNVDMDMNSGGMNGSKPVTAVPIQIQRVDQTELWPRKVRSDITRNIR